MGGRYCVAQSTAHHQQRQATPCCFFNQGDIPRVQQKVCGYHQPANAASPLPASPNSGGGAGSGGVRFREKKINSRNPFPPSIGGTRSRLRRSRGAQGSGRPKPPVPTRPPPPNPLSVTPCSNTALATNGEGGSKTWNPTPLLCWIFFWGG